MHANSKLKDSLALIAVFFAAYPARSALMLACLLLAGLAEGIGLATLLPLLKHLGGSQADVTVIDRFVQQTLDYVGLESTLGALLGLIVLAMVSKGAFLLVAMNQVGYTVAYVATDLRLALIRAVLGARWRFFVSQPAGLFANAISTEATRASAAYHSACLLLADSLQVFIYLLVAATISWHLTAIVAVAGALLLLLFWRLLNSARSAGESQTRLQKSILARLTDGLRGIKPLKAMAREDRLGPMLVSETQGLNQALRRQVFHRQVLDTQQEPVIVVLLALGLFAVVTGWQLPTETVIMMGLLFYRAASRIGNLQKRYQAMIINESAYWSLKALVEHAESEREPKTAGKIAALEKGIRFEDVSFAYDGKKVLDAVNLEIPAHAFVAITGSSGAGKTTLADLIVGLHRPESGRIRVDDVPFDELDLAAWRSLIGYVPQEMTLFHDTILANVTLGDSALTREAAEAALAKADLLSYVRSLPQGLDTVVGEQGSKLSGGQRQRLAIARALVRSPSLLVLDEVTTSLDPATEREICATLRALAGQITILAISHQPAVVSVSDIVLRVESGKVTPDKADVRRADGAV